MGGSTCHYVTAFADLQIIKRGISSLQNSHRLTELHYESHCHSKVCALGYCLILSHFHSSLCYCKLFIIDVFIRCQNAYAQAAQQWRVSGTRHISHHWCVTRHVFIHAMTSPCLARTVVPLVQSFVPYTDCDNHPQPYGDPYSTNQ